MPTPLLWYVSEAESVSRSQGKFIKQKPLTP
jgi:hypothetical protein